MANRTFKFADNTVAYWESGEGFPLLMLHGVGPGTSIAGNFGPVLEPLAKKFHVFGMDLIGFGESERRRQKPFFDVEFWVQQGLAMLDVMPPGPVGVIGHSLGGALAIKIASRSDRVIKVFTSSSIGAPFPVTAALDRFWSIPNDRDELYGSMVRMVYDTKALTNEMIDMRWSLLKAPGYADYFVEMFSGNRQHLLDQAVLSEDEIRRFSTPLLMLHGYDDHACPAEQTSIPVAKRLAADAQILGRCGHNLPRERTVDYLEAAFRFLPTS